MSITTPIIADQAANKLTQTVVQTAKVASGSTASNPSLGSKIKDQSPPSSGIEISISTSGKRLSESISHERIRSAEQAKTAVRQISAQLESNPEPLKELHSNLRLMRINHLLYD